jgi:hypothetical protein
MEVLTFTIYDKIFLLFVYAIKGWNDDGNVIVVVADCRRLMEQNLLIDSC